MTDLARGQVVWYGERGEFTNKPRPGVIVQRNSTLADAPSVTLCGLTTTSMPTHASRVPVSPTTANGLETTSFVMIDKVVSISRGRIRRVVGALNEDEMAQVDTVLRRWLDL